MLKLRLIPVVLLRNGVVVQSRRFRRYQVLGNPTTVVERLGSWASDELIYLDISRQPIHAEGRKDLGSQSATCLLDILRNIAKNSFMPLAFGGGVRTLHDIEQRLLAGADKVTLNTAAAAAPTLIRLAAKEFGSQAIIVSIDVLRDEQGNENVYISGGRHALNKSPTEWAAEVETLGAGEILLNSINQDGMKTGYDLELIQRVAQTVAIPVIACGGVGEWRHLAEGLTQTAASAVAAANIFHYTENSVYNAKKYLFDAGFNVRAPEFQLTFH